MAKAKAAKADNVVPIKPELAEDAVKALNIAKVRRDKEAAESAAGVYRSTLSHVDGKLNVKAVKKALSLIKSGKQDEWIAEVAAVSDYLRILGRPIDKAQLDLFVVEQPRTPAVDRAAREGRYVGIMGGGQDQCQYALDSEQGHAWIDAWKAGCDERKLGLALEPAPGSELIKGEEPAFPEETRIPAE